MRPAERKSVGGARDAAGVMRTVTFAGGVVSEVPAFPGVANTGVDIADTGAIAGNVTAADGTQHAFVTANGATVQIPDLAGATGCQAVAISQNGGWVAGSCAGRGFRYNVASGSTTELLNLTGAAGGEQVWSVNSQGTAVGEIGGKAVVWNPGATMAVDLAGIAGTPLSRATDINDNGWILATYLDASYRFTTYLLKPA